MLDPRFIRENPDIVKDALAKRNNPFDLDAFLALDKKRRELLTEIEGLRSEKNKANDEIKSLLKKKEDISVRVQEMKDISVEEGRLEGELKKLQDQFDKGLLSIPNIPHESVPVGKPENYKIVKTWKEPEKISGTPRSHVEIAEHLDIIDFKRATKLTGSNYVLYKKDGALLERALINFMLDIHTQEHGYTEVFPPFVVNRDSMTATGQLPKMEEDMYSFEEANFFLIPTAEVPVTNIHRDEILDEENLPVCYVAYTPCFRREAGSYGKDTRGLMRVHQFDKVEMVKFVKPEDSYEELEKLLGNACTILEKLDIPYRVLALTSQDISFAAAKCYDIEIYAPGLAKWLEVSSCSNFEDFQARRGNIRYRDKESGKPAFLHTLNGSGVALARLVACILENYQNEDGSVTIPEPLRKYMHGKTRIA